MSIRGEPVQCPASSTRRDKDAGYKCIAENLQKFQQILCTMKAQVVSNAAVRDKSKLEPCTQEEADSRIMLHVMDAANQGHQRILIRTADTDVLILAVANIPQVQCL